MAVDIKKLVQFVGGIPQSVDLTASGNVTWFDNIKLGSLTASRPLKLDSSNKLTSAYILDADVDAAAAIAYSKLAAMAASKALVSDASGFVTTSSVTSVELGYMRGVTGSVQNQLNAKINLVDRGVADGIATLDGGGKIPAAQLPNSVMEFQGMWNPTTNTPALADGVGNNGDVYRVTAAFAGPISGLSDSSMVNFLIGESLIYNGSAYQKSPISDGVISVNGLSGAVVLDTDDISELGTPTNKWFTDARAQAAAVAQSITDGVTTSAPSQNEVFDALALKVPTSLEINGHVLTGSFSITKTDVGLGNVTNDAQLKAADLDTSTALGSSDTKIPSQNAVKVYADTKVPNTLEINGHVLTGSFSISKTDVSLGNVDNVQQLPMSYLDTNTSLGSSDVKVPSQNAVKTYVDTAIGTVGVFAISGVAGEAFAANATYFVRYGLTAETAGRVYKVSKLVPADKKYWAVGAIQVGGTSLSAGDACTIIKLGEIHLKSGDTNVASGSESFPIYIGDAGAFSVDAPATGLDAGTAYASLVVGQVKVYNATVTNTIISVEARQLMGVDIA